MKSAFSGRKLVKVTFDFDAEGSGELSSMYSFKMMYCRLMNTALRNSPKGRHS
jgi:hypothetical protein